MLYFERTNKMANLCFVCFALFFILMVILFMSSHFSEIIKYNFTNDLRGAIYTAICFMISMVSLILGIILKVITREVNEEMKLLEKRLNGTK